MKDYNQRTRGLVLDKLYEDTKSKLIMLVSDYMECEEVDPDEAIESIVDLIKDDLTSAKIEAQHWPDIVERNNSTD